MGNYSQSFQRELPGIAEFLRLASIAGFIMIFIMFDWSYLQFDHDGDFSGPVFRITGISIFLASLATFFEVLGDTKIKKKKVILGILILVGGQYSPFLHIYTGDYIRGAGSMPLIGDFIALACISILLWRINRVPEATS